MEAREGSIFEEVADYIVEVENMEETGVEHPNEARGSGRNVGERG